MENKKRFEDIDILGELAKPLQKYLMENLDTPGKIEVLYDRVLVVENKVQVLTEIKNA